MSTYIGLLAIERGSMCEGGYLTIGEPDCPKIERRLHIRSNCKVLKLKYLYVVWARTFLKSNEPGSEGLSQPNKRSRLTQSFGFELGLYHSWSGT